MGGDTRASLKAAKHRVRDIEAKLQDASDVAQAKELDRQRGELRNQLNALRASEDQLSRDGHHSAVCTLNGHVGLVSSCALQEDNGKTTLSILSSSWDQTIQLFNLNTQELA